VDCQDKVIQQENLPHVADRYILVVHKLPGRFHIHPGHVTPYLTKM